MLNGKDVPLQWYNYVRLSHYCISTHVAPSAHGWTNFVTLLKSTCSLIYPLHPHHTHTHTNTHTHTHTATQVSTTAASTKAEDTVPPSGMTEGRSENVPLTKFESLLSRRKGSDGLELELHVATSTPPPDSTGSPRRTQVYPMSADVLSDRDSRSMSEERYVYSVQCLCVRAVVLWVHA